MEPEDIQEDPTEGLIDLGDEPEVAPEPEGMTQDQIRDIALRYAIESGEFVPRSMYEEVTNRQVVQPEAQPDEFEPYEGESMAQYQRRITKIQAQEVAKMAAAELSQVYGIGAQYGATEHVLNTVKASGLVPAGAEGALRETVTGLLAANPKLAASMDGPTIQNIAALAVGKAFQAGKLAPAAPTTSREPGFTLPADLVPVQGKTAKDVQEAAQMFQYFNDRKATKDDLRKLGVVK